MTKPVSQLPHHASGSRLAITAREVQRGARRVLTDRAAVDAGRGTGRPIELLEFDLKLGPRPVGVIRGASGGIRIGNDRVGVAIDRHCCAGRYSATRFSRTLGKLAPPSCIFLWFWYSAIHGVSRISRARSWGPATSVSTIPATRSTAISRLTGAASICGCQNNLCADGCPILPR
jgi:hypothetical protein